MRPETWKFGAYEPAPFGDGGEQHIVRAADGEHLAVVDCADGDMRLARLVKAAPELLAACEKLITAAECGSGVLFYEAADLARAALARAATATADRREVAG